MICILMDDMVVELATPSDPPQWSGSDLLGSDGVASATDTLIDYNAPYMTTTYMDKNINDIYSMLVSVRNSVLLLTMVILVFEIHKVAKNAFKRHYRR